MARVVRLIVGGDGLVVRSGLIRLAEQLGHEVAGVASRFEQLPALAAAHRPDVVVMDVRVRAEGTARGLRAAAVVRAGQPEVGTLVLSDVLVPGYVADLLAGGTLRSGYLLTERLADPAALDDALCRIRAGEVVIDPTVVARAPARHRAGDPLAALTGRERDVLRLMAEGLTNLGIARGLRITPNTVNTHVQRVFTKLVLPDTATDNRRVLAVRAFLASVSPRP